MKKNIALVLSSGGSRGFTHIGALMDFNKKIAALPQQ